MTRELHPIATLTLRVLTRDDSGHLVLDPAAEDAIRAELAPAEKGDGLRAALVALVEVAFTLDQSYGASAATKKLRALASEYSGSLATQLQRARNSAAERQRGLVNRFARFSGNELTASMRPPAPPARGTLRLSDLCPPRAITAR